MVLVDNDAVPADIANLREAPHQPRRISKKRALEEPIGIGHAFLTAQPFFALVNGEQVNPFVAGFWLAVVVDAALPDLPECVDLSWSSFCVGETVAGQRLGVN